MTTEQPIWSILHFCSRSPMTSQKLVFTNFQPSDLWHWQKQRRDWQGKSQHQLPLPSHPAFKIIPLWYYWSISSVQLTLDLQLIWNLPQVGSQWPRPPFAAACKLSSEDTIMMWDLRFTFATSGDQIHPGETEFTLIWYFARSNAMFFVRMLTAPLDAA